MKYNFKCGYLIVSTPKQPGNDKNLTSFPKTKFNIE